MTRTPGRKTSAWFALSQAQRGRIGYDLEREIAYGQDTTADNARRAVTAGAILSALLAVDPSLRRAIDAHRKKS